MSENPSEMYWYNMRTGEVEKGYVTPSVDRVGPFATESEAQHALEKLRENSERWDADEREGA
jgi:hypothetical protein